MKSLVIIRQGFCAHELKKLLGARLISASEAASLMLSRLRRNEVSEAPNKEGLLVRVCIASDEAVLDALHTLARHTDISIKEIDVVEVQVAS